MKWLISKIRKASSLACLSAPETNTSTLRSTPGELETFEKKNTAPPSGFRRSFRDGFRRSTQLPSICWTQQTACLTHSTLQRRHLQLPASQPISSAAPSVGLAESFIPGARRTFNGNPSAHGHMQGRNQMLEGVMSQETTMTTALDALVDTIHKGEGVPKDVRVTKQLGKGGFGEVWLATGTLGGNKMKLALKKLKHPILFRPNSKDAERVLKEMPYTEVIIQSLLVHQNIVQTFGADVMIIDPHTNQPLNIDLHAVMADKPSQESADTQASSNSSGSRLARSLSTGGWTQVNVLLDHTCRLGLPEEVGLIIRIAMEYCDAGSMLKYLQQSASKKVPPMHMALSRGMDLTLCSCMTARDIARGLKLLHKSRFIHGDLKPHNILLSYDQQDPRGFIAKVSDFGLSAYLRKGEDQISNITCGSVPYMAPESLKHRALTKMSDVYGFGILMWELWHCEFWGIHHIQEFQYRKGLNPDFHQAGMADHKPRCHPACPEQYAQLVHDCLESDPLKRPTMKTVTMKLENYLEDLMQLNNTSYSRR